MKLMGIYIPDNDGTKTSIVAGMIGGIWSTIANINLPTDFVSKLLEATLTAGMCGAAGWVGKLIVQTAYRSLKMYFLNRKKPKQ